MDIEIRYYVKFFFLYILRSLSQRKNIVPSLRHLPGVWHLPSLSCGFQHEREFGDSVPQPNKRSGDKNTHPLLYNHSSFILKSKQKDQSLKQYFYSLSNCCKFKNMETNNICLGKVLIRFVWSLYCVSAYNYRGYFSI